MISQALSKAFLVRGTVQTGGGAGAVLTISDGGSFSGGITGSGLSGGLNLIGGTLTLSGGGLSSYAGTTTINNLATLQAGATNAFSSNSDVVVAGTLALGNHANAINSLSGFGSVVTGGAAGILTISDGGNFTGSFSGAGGLVLIGGTLNLNPVVADSINYTGSTTLSNNAVLFAEGENVFAPLSSVTLDDVSTLNLNGYSQVIHSLSSTSGSTVVQMGGGGPGAILTINGGETTSFAGQVTNLPCGGLTISGGTNLTLSNATNDYCGPTSIENGILQVTSGGLSINTDVTVAAAGQLVVLQDDGAESLVNNGTVNLALDVNNISSGSDATLTLTTYEQSSSASLNLGFSTGAMGNIVTTGDISIDGELNVYATNPYPNTGIHPLLTTTGGFVNGSFSDFNTIGFGSDNPNINYTLQEVNLFFADVDAAWAQSGDGVWGIGTNWNPPISPGINNPDTIDIANFNDVGGFPPTITVTLADHNSDDPPPPPSSVSPILFEMNFNAVNTQFSIELLASDPDGTITFNAPNATPQLNLLQGSHFINVPILLARNTEFVLADGATLTLNSSASVASNTTGAMVIHQSGGSTLGTGTLVNNTTVSPYEINMFAATVQNTSNMTPINGLTIGALSGQNATFLNSGIDALAGPTADGALLIIGGDGTTVVVNSGTGAIFGPQGVDGDLLIGSTGTTTVTNNGEDAFFGPQGVGGDLIIQGANTTV